MHKILFGTLCGILAIAACGANLDTSPEPTAEAEAPAEVAVPISEDTSLTFTAIDGSPLSLSQYAGKAVLVVNTASKCGYTPQFSGLQALWSEYREEGLVVVGVPSGDFADQELNEASEIKEFCEINYGVDFPLTQKSHVVGEARHPFFAMAESTLGETAVPQWNFHKILLGPDLQPIAAFPSAVTPEDASLVAAVEEALPG
ncbi:MAG: glutathione peroxidase [Hyphomonadaceae bacterium]|nr:glutathione peroxidase [Hyphomonadaceae bacterium]